jgi:ribosomal protein S18 acetylase RimI-like enzyme
MAKRDYQAAYDLWNEIDGMGLRSLDDTFGGISKFLARNPATCFVAEEEGRIAGTILCGHDGRRAYIYHLAVKEDKRGKGYGRALVDAVEAALEKEGIMKVALVVYKNNELGNAFWEGIGYTLREDLNYRNKSLNEENE